MTKSSSPPTRAVPAPGLERRKHDTTREGEVMKTIVKAVSITAGGIAVGAALTLGMAFGALVGVLNPDDE